MSHEWYFSREGEVFGLFPEEELSVFFGRVAYPRRTFYGA